ncbi:MAG: hydrogenase expression/formation protein HypD [Geminicoccaceae bacterium]|nr:hydrogenase expression/formation protein HypD [Geminicoccaceae bacterium]
MKYLSEYRDASVARGLIARIRELATRRWVLMEVCGGQTHTIVRQGLDQLLGDAVEMIHGPGCPVCVTPLEQIDKALQLAADPSVIFTSFGDMLRVPGSECDLLQIRARGGEVRVVYSPLDALEIAIRNPGKQVVFFAVGFETTAPANAMAVWRARELGVRNFSVLVSHVTVPPAITALLSAPDNRVQAFLAAGHVCTVMGWTEYEPIAARYQVPIIVTGFEPVDIIEGIYLAVRQLEEGRHEVENQYVRSVRREGTPPARNLVAEVFHLVNRQWRGIGEIPASGLGLREEFADFDAEYRFGLESLQVKEPAECRAGDVLRGRIKPHQCPAFGTRCTPEHPLGAPMVSSEGACAAYYQYGRFRQQQPVEV